MVLAKPKLNLALSNLPSQAPEEAKAFLSDVQGFLKNGVPHKVAEATIISDVASGDGLVLRVDGVVVFPNFPSEELGQIVKTSQAHYIPVIFVHFRDDLYGNSLEYNVGPKDRVVRYTNLALTLSEIIKTLRQIEKKTA